jgi:hypothetical protein
LALDASFDTYFGPAADVNSQSQSKIDRALLSWLAVLASLYVHFMQDENAFVSHIGNFGIGRPTAVC